MYKLFALLLYQLLNVALCVCSKHRCRCYPATPQPHTFFSLLLSSFLFVAPRMPEVHPALFCARVHDRRFTLRSLGHCSNATAHGERLRRYGEQALACAHVFWALEILHWRTTVQNNGPLKMFQILRAVPACVSSAVLRSRGKTAR